MEHVLPFGTLRPFFTDEEAAVREEVAEYFEDLPDPESISPLTVLLDDVDTDVAEKAAEALRHAGESGVPPMEAYYLAGTNPYNAYQVGQELARVDQRNVIAQGITRWRDLLVNGDAGLRRLGVRGLGRFGQADQDAHFVRQMLEDPDRRVASRAAEVLSNWGLE